MQYGYYDASNWKHAGRIDMIVETWSDVLGAAAKILMFTPEHEKAAAMVAFRDGLCDKFLMMIEKQLDDNQLEKFLVGDRITIADFVVASFTFNILLNPQNPLKPILEPILLEYPHFDGYYKRLRNETKKHLDKRHVAAF